jgi:hypothetical protein
MEPSERIRIVDLLITSAASGNLPQSVESSESQNPCNIETSETERKPEDPGRWRVCPHGLMALNLAHLPSISQKAPRSRLFSAVRTNRHQTALRDTLLLGLQRRIGRELRAFRDRVFDTAARSTRPAFASAIRMTTLLPNTLAARVIVSNETETLRGSSRRSS